MKSILVRAIIEGSGIVNFDSNDQRWLWNRQKNVEIVRHNNVSFGKGRYYEFADAEGNLYLKKNAIISADCIRHAMFENNMPVHLPNIMHDDMLLIKAVASPAFLERGYLFARDGKTTWKRTSPFKITYAKAVEQSETALETFANSQSRERIDKSEESSETSFFKREVRGDMKYEVFGVINTSELSFIPISDIHDRFSFDPDYVSVFRSILSEHLGSEVPEPLFFIKKGNCYEIPEYGIMLTEDQTKQLALDILKRLARFNLQRTVTGYARATSVQIKFVKDPLEDTFEDDAGWISVYNSNNKFNSGVLDSVNFDNFYDVVNDLTEAKTKCDEYRKKFGFIKEKKAKGKKSIKEDGKD